MQRLLCLTDSAAPKPQCNPSLINLSVWL